MRVHLLAAGVAVTLAVGCYESTDTHITVDVDTAAEVGTDVRVVFQRS